MKLLGRNNEIKLFEDFLFKSSTPILYIYGHRGIGKSSLINFCLEKNMNKIKGKVLHLSANFHGMIEKDLLIEGGDILVIDDFYEVTRGSPFNVNPNNSFIRQIVDNKLFKKIIVSSVSKPLLSTENIKGRIEYFKINPLETEELLASFGNIFDKANEKELLKLFEYFGNIPRHILIGYNAFDKSGFNSLIDFIELINKPLVQSGLIDINGNPLTIESIAGKKIIEDVSVINTSLIEKVKNSPRLIYELTSRQFEELVAELLEREGFKVNLTKQTRDGGKDIFVAENNNLGNFLYYVECKKYSFDRPVGVNLVRELYGTISADRATAGLLVTSSYFSKDAVNFIQNIQHQMSLKDYLDLKNWIG